MKMNNMTNNGIGRDACKQTIFIGSTVAHIQVPYGKTRFNATLKKVIGYNEETGRVQVDSGEKKSWIEPYNCIVTNIKEGE